MRTDLNREVLMKDALGAYLEKRIPTGRPTEPEVIARLTAALFQEPKLDHSALIANVGRLGRGEAKPKPSGLSVARTVSSKVPGTWLGLVRRLAR